jgi:hypothetical protein
MSLIAFHRFLISAAIVFCIGYGGWEAAAFTRTRSTGSLVMAVVFVGLGLGLAWYLSRLARFLTGRSDVDVR